MYGKHGHVVISAVCRKRSAMSTLYRRDSSCAGTKNISDRAFAHTKKRPFPIEFCAGAMLRCFGLEGESSHIGKVFVTLS